MLQHKGKLFDFYQPEDGKLLIGFNFLWVVLSWQKPWNRELRTFDILIFWSQKHES